MYINFQFKCKNNSYIKLLSKKMKNKNYIELMFHHTAKGSFRNNLSNTLFRAKSRGMLMKMAKYSVKMGLNYLAVDV
jgi:hypothetical protein